MKKILVSGASGIVGYGILKSLNQSKKELQLFGTTIFEDSVAPAFSDVFIKAPLTNDAGYIDWLLGIINTHKIDMIIPGIDADMYKWAENIEVLESSGAKVMMNNLALISLCKDKWAFYEYLSNTNNVNTINSSLADTFDEVFEQFGLPLLLKPRHGFGSKGIVRVYDKNTFLQHKENIGQTLMVQPLIGNDDEEYTTSAFCDGEGGFLASMTLKRKLSKDGFTDKAEVVEPEGIEEVLKSLCKTFNPLGPTNFQFRMQDGILKLLEINPRVSSSTSIRSSFGYNESLMAVEYYLENKKPVQPIIRQGKAVRYIEDYIFYK